MGIKDELKKTVDNIGDTIDEAGHRGSADAESAARDVAGESMTPGERLGSVVREGKERVLADVDRAKVDVRNA
jgi:hypothetical protein